MRMPTLDIAIASTSRRITTALRLVSRRCVARLPRRKPPCAAGGRNGGSPVRGTLLLLALATGCTSGAFAQNFPTKPIVLLFPFAAGGSIEQGMRVLAAEASKQLGQPVLVEPRPGGNGLIALNALKAAHGDAHLIGVFNNGTLVTLPLTSKTSVEQGRDYTPVGLVLSTNLIIVTHASAPFRTLPQMIAYAKANPGKVDMAVVGTASNTHLALELLKDAAGVSLTNIPYKGEAQAVPDILSGAVKSGILGAAAKPHVEAGKMLGVATTGTTRWSVFPDLPTVRELGYPDYAVVGWFGLVAPPGTPPAVVAKLNAAFRAAAKVPTARKTVEASGLDVLESSPEELSAYIKSETARWSPIIKKAGIRID